MSDSFRIVIGSAMCPSNDEYSLTSTPLCRAQRALLCSQICIKSHRHATEEVQIRNNLSHGPAVAQLYWCWEISVTGSVVKQHTALHFVLYQTSRLPTHWPVSIKTQRLSLTKFKYVMVTFMLSSSSSSLLFTANECVPGGSGTIQYAK